MARLIIGPSTGWLYAQGINSLADQKAILIKAGVNAVEFCIGVGLKNTDVRIASMLTGEAICFTGRHRANSEEFWDYRSVHLPDYSPTVELWAQVDMVARMTLKQAVHTALIHPLKIDNKYPAAYYDRLVSRNGCRIAIENMDKRKSDGFLLPELANLLLSHELRFVLDVQHAFEHDSSMSYAWDLFQAFGSRLVHLHVSGESDINNHCLVCRAKNARQIIEFLGRLFSKTNVPIILEGEYKTFEDLQKEIGFIKKELGI